MGVSNVLRASGHFAAAAGTLVLSTAQAGLTVFSYMQPENNYVVNGLIGVFATTTAVLGVVSGMQLVKGVQVLKKPEEENSSPAPE